jgi:chromosome segregation ATPase
MVWITYEDVAGIVTTALEDGLSTHQITTRYVKESFGSGGLSTISQHLKRYWSENAVIGVSASIASSNKMHDLHRVVAEIVAEQTTEVRTAENARAVEFAIELAKARDELAFALDTNAELEVSLGVRDNEINVLRQTVADAHAATARLEGELIAERVGTNRENERLSAELVIARAETLQAQIERAEALGKLEVFKNGRAEVAEQMDAVLAGHQASEAKIERLQGALDELRRERDAALSSSTTTSAAPKSVTQIPSVEMPNASAQAVSIDEVNG